MEENNFNLTFLLGTEYILLHQKTTKKKLLEMIPFSRSNFIDRLQKILIYLSTFKTLDWLSSTFHISKYLLESIVSSYKSCGICNVCNVYYSKIRKHLKSAHSLKVDLINYHSYLFSKTFYFYMPKDFRFIQESLAFAGKMKPKIKKPVTVTKVPPMKILFELPNLTSDSLRTPNSVICGECGEVVEKTKKKNHIRTHQRNQIIGCPVCKVTFKRRFITEHYKTCGI